MGIKTTQINKLDVLSSLFCSQFFFKRRNIVDTMTDFKGEMRAKEAVKMFNLLF